MAERREMPADGQMYIVGQGPALKEGERISFAFTNLPHAPLWPRYVAIGIAVVILIAGVWASMNVKTARSSEQERLEKRRGTCSPNWRRSKTNTAPEPWKRQCTRASAPSSSPRSSACTRRSIARPLSRRAWTSRRSALPTSRAATAAAGRSAASPSAVTPARSSRCSAPMARASRH